MNKRILIACLVALIGVWVSLTMLGKRILPCAPIHKAWIVPLGSAGWEYVMTGMAEEGMTTDALTSILGTPDDVPVSSMHRGQVYLHYTNPHDNGRGVLFAISKDRKVLYVAPEGPLPAGMHVSTP